MSFTVMSNIIITAAQTTKHTTWPQDNCCREPGFQFRESHAAQAGPADLAGEPALQGAHLAVTHLLERLPGERYGILV